MSKTSAKKPGKGRVIGAEPVSEGHRKLSSCQLSVTNLAKKLGYTQGLVSRWRSGEIPSRIAQPKLAAELGIALGDWDRAPIPQIGQQELSASALLRYTQMELSRQKLEYEREKLEAGRRKFALREASAVNQAGAETPLDDIPPMARARLLGLGWRPPEPGIGAPWQARAIALGWRPPEGYGWRSEIVPGLPMPGTENNEKDEEK